MWAPGALLVVVSAGLLWSALHPRGPASPPSLRFDDPRRHPSSAPVLVVEPPSARPGLAVPPAAVVAAAAAPAPTPPAPAGGAPLSADRIPGIEAEDLLDALTRAGLRCSQGRIEGRTLTWTCSADTRLTYYSVQVHASGTDAVRSIVADVSEHTDQPAEVRSAMFLGSLAALAYRDSEPQRARQWVAENIMRAASMSVGPVRFQLSGGGRARSLLMTVEDGR
jgi:hypothetical protein